MSKFARRVQQTKDLADVPQYKELVADILAMVKRMRRRLAAGRLEAFDTLAAESDRQSPPARKRRTIAKTHLMKGRRK